VLEYSVLRKSIVVAIESLNATVRNAIVMENNKRRIFIERD